MAGGLEQLSGEETLREVSLFSLRRRQLRGAVTPCLSLSAGRGQSMEQALLPGAERWTRGTGRNWWTESST